MSEKIVSMAVIRLHQAGKRKGITWDDLVAYDPTGRLRNVRGVAQRDAVETAMRKCGLGKRPRSEVYDFLETGAQWDRKTRRT